MAPPRRADRYAVVMAGGTGTRFWPRSRHHRPKQLLRAVGARSLLQETVARLHGLVPPAQTLIVTNVQHAVEVRRQLPEIPARNVLVEPVGRNTAPCVTLAALEIARRAPAATLVSLPADHAITDARAFRTTLATAFAWAGRAPRVVTLGVRPTAPETGYGYIRVGAALGRGVHRARAFVEKPSRARARRFVATREYLWNSGMFVWQVPVLLDLVDMHLPSVGGRLRRAMAAPRHRRLAALRHAYARLPSISIDHGIMEHADDILVVRADFGWSDVGSWAAWAALPSRNGRGAPVVPVDASGYVVISPDRLVALVGVRDLIVVDAADALLICHRERAQDVRLVVDELRRRRLQSYL